MNEVARWFLEKQPDELARKVRLVAERMWQNGHQDRDGMHRMAKLYGNTPTGGLSPRSYRRRPIVGESRRLSFNIVKAVSDAYVSLVTDDQPKASFITTGADWDLQEKAKMLEKFSDGALYETELYDAAPLIALHSAVWPFGVVTSYIDDIDPDKPRLAIDRCYPWEILTDDVDSMYGKPRVEVRIRHEDRYEQEQRYPKFKDEIRTATDQGFDYEGELTVDMEATSDRVVVIEIWRLPRSPISNDGLYVKVIGNKVVERSIYKWPVFPNFRLYQQDPMEGNQGPSLAENLSGVQFEINSLLLRVQKSYIAGAGHWLIESGAQVNTNQLNDVVGAFIRYTGRKPEFVVPQAVTPDTYAHLDRLWAKGFQYVGLSEQAAMAQKPAGLNSGKAQMVFADVQNKRLKPSYRNYEKWVMQISRHFLRLAQEAGEKHESKGIIVRSPVSRSIGAAVKWADAKLDESEYLVKIYPTNAFANDPAALMQSVTDMLSGGVIQAQDAARLLSMNPDLETFFSYANASYDLTMKMVDGMLHRGEFQAPEPEMNLEKALMDVQMAYLKARLDGAPQKRLDLLLRWMARAQDELKAKNPPAPPPGAAPPPPGPAGPPPGAPPAPPAPPMMGAA